MKAEIRLAFKSDKIADISQAQIEDFMVFCFGKYETMIGQGKGSTGEYQAATAQMFAQELKRNYGHLYLQEVSVAIDGGAKLLFGEVKPASFTTFLHYLRSYLATKERKAILEENTINEPFRQLPERPMTAREERELMLSKWKLVGQAVSKNQLYADTGSVLFDYMEKKGKIKLDPMDYVNTIEYYESIVTDKMLSMLSIKFQTAKEKLQAYKRHGDESGMIPIAKKFALVRLYKELNFTKHV